MRRGGVLPKLIAQGGRPRQSGCAGAFILTCSTCVHAPRIWRRPLRSSKLARIVSPAVHLCVRLWVPLLWQQDEPLLTRLLVKVSGSASHAHSKAPPGRMLRARGLRLSVSPSAMRLTVPVDQIMCGLLESLSKYFQRQSTSIDALPHQGLVKGRRLRNHFGGDAPPSQSVLAGRPPCQ